MLVLTSLELFTTWLEEDDEDALLDDVEEPIAKTKLKNTETTPRIFYILDYCTASDKLLFIRFELLRFLKLNL